MNDKRVYRVILSVLLIAVSAHLAFDITATAERIPISGQSLALMVCCIFLTPTEAIFAVVCYLMLGGLGLPVFADGSSGWEKFSGGSGGFLYGFLIVGMFISYLGTMGYRSTFSKALIAMVLSTVLLLFIGNAHLAFKYGWEKALEYGFYPFWKGAIIKALMGALIIYFLNKNAFFLKTKTN